VQVVLKANHQLQEVTTDSNARELIFLGLLISTISMAVSLPKEKLHKLQHKARSLPLRSEVTVQTLAAFVEMTTATKQAIHMSHLYRQQIQALIIRE